MSLRPNFGWLLLGLLGVIGAGALCLAVVQHRGVNELGGALAQGDADRAWLAALPRVDPALRERSWQWMKAPWPTGQSTLGDKEERWYLAGDKPPAELLERHAAERAHMATLDDILAAGGSVLSGAAWATPDLSTSGAGPYGSHHIPNLLSVRGAMRWYGAEAMLAEDPSAALDQIDRMFGALQPAASLVEALILVSVSSMRDRIYLRAIYRSALPEARIEGWLAETCGADRWHLDAYRAERLLLWEPLARGVMAGRADAKRALYGDSPGVQEELDYRWHARTDIAHILEAWRLCEDYLSGRCDADALHIIATWEREGGRVVAMARPSQSGLLWSVVSSRTQHRMCRLLARALRLEGAAATTEADFVLRLPEVADLLDAGPFDLALRYQHVADDRIRFYVPRDTPLPDLLEPERFTQAFDGADRDARFDDLLLKHTAGYAIEARLSR